MKLALLIGVFIVVIAAISLLNKFLPADDRERTAGKPNNDQDPRDQWYNGGPGIM